MTTAAPLPALLSLPPELRNQIYDEVVVDDLFRFAATFGLPPLLKVCKQLRDEYCGVFFSDENLTLNAYYHETGCWDIITGKWQKLYLIERCLFKHLVSYSSLASAQRYCERAAFNAPGTRRGILTVQSLNARWWQWQMRD